MLHFEGERSFELPVETLWAKLRDAAFLAESIPDASVEGTPTRDRATCTVQPGVSFVRGTLDVTLEVVEAQEPTLVRYRITSKGVGSGAVVTAALRLSAQGERSQANWAVDVESLTGLLKMVPSGLIRGAAQKVIEDVWNAVTARLT
jgi:carbon monoxide dehydrogenase subunit G